MDQFDIIVIGGGSAGSAAAGRLAADGTRRVCLVEAGGANDLDTVKVVGAALRETKTSEVATYVSPRQMEALPQASRNFLAYADIVPGVQFVKNNNGETQLRSGAQSANNMSKAMAAVNHALTSKDELGAEWKDKIAELGLIFDRKTKLYTDPAKGA